MITVKDLELIKMTETGAVEIFERTKGLTIVNDIDYTQAGNQLKAIKGKQKDLEEKRKAITKPMDEAKKQVMELFKPATEYLENAELRVKTALLNYGELLEKKRKEAEALLQEQARKEAEKLASRADKAEATGKTEKADMLRQQAQEAVIPPKVDFSAPKISGIGRAKIFKFIIERPDEVERQYCCPDEQKIRRIISATEGKIEIKGIKIWQENTIRSGR